jgi:hypothetical protein
MSSFGLLQPNKATSIFEHNDTQSLILKFDNHSSLGTCMSLVLKTWDFLVPGFHPFVEPRRANHDMANKYLLHRIKGNHNVEVEDNNSLVLLRCGALLNHIRLPNGDSFTVREFSRYYS